MQLDKLSDWQKCGKLWVIYNYIVELPWINMSNLLCAVFFFSRSAEADVGI